MPTSTTNPAMPNPNANRPVRARLAQSRGLRVALSCAAIAGAAFLGACSSSRTTYVHSDNGKGGASSADALGYSIGSRLKSERRATRVDADLPMFLTVAPGDNRASSR